MFDILLFIHLAGIIIGLGAVTVIDSLGFVSRNSKELTQVTIGAHHITKPLIWLGTVLIVISMVGYFYSNQFNSILYTKTILLIIMILNGIFLSFYVSPKLDELQDKKVLLPKELKIKITISMLTSFFSWWTFVVLTVLQIS